MKRLSNRTLLVVTYGCTLLALLGGWFVLLDIPAVVGAALLGMRIARLRERSEEFLRRRGAHEEQRDLDWP